MLQWWTTQQGRLEIIEISDDDEDESFVKSVDTVGNINEPLSEQQLKRNKQPGPIDVEAQVSEKKNDETPINESTEQQPEQNDNDLDTEKGI